MSSQQGPKAAPGQHSAHILLVIILREPHSATANFLDFVGEGSGLWARFSPRRRSGPCWVGYTRCGSFNMRPSCASSRLAAETFREKSAGPLLRSSSAWQCSSCAYLWFLSPLFNRRSTGCDPMIRCSSSFEQRDIYVKKGDRTRQKPLDAYMIK